MRMNWHWTACQRWSWRWACSYAPSWQPSRTWRWRPRMPSGFPSCSSPGFPGNRLVEAIFPPFFYLNLLDCLIREIVFRAKSFKHLNFQCCISFLILCCCSLNCLMVTANTPWCRGFSSSHQRRLLGFSPRLGSLGAHRCETPSSSGSARQNN